MGRRFGSDAGRESPPGASVRQRRREGVTPLVIGSAAKWRGGHPPERRFGSGAGRGSPLGASFRKHGEEAVWMNTTVRSAPEAMPAMVRPEVEGLGKVEGFAVVTSRAGGAQGR